MRKFKKTLVALAVSLSSIVFAAGCDLAGMLPGIGNFGGSESSMSISQTDSSSKNSSSIKQSSSSSSSDSSSSSSSSSDSSSSSSSSSDSSSSSSSSSDSSSSSSSSSDSSSSSSSSSDSSSSSSSSSDSSSSSSSSSDSSSSSSSSSDSSSSGDSSDVPGGNPGDIVEPEVVTSAEVENFACNIEPQEEGQFNNNAEASNINPHFEVEATFNGGDENGLIGFAFTAEDGKVMRFAYDKVKGRFGFIADESGWDHYREYELETDVYNAEGANTIKVVYNGNRIFEVYMNGTKMVAMDGRQGQFYLGWDCRGTAGDSSMTQMKPYQMWGSSTIDSRATLTISAYASDAATVISGFSCEVTGGYVPGDNPGDIVEPEVVTSAEVENFACNIEPQEEGQFNNNAEASIINPHFEVEATFNGGDKNGLIGFAFTAEEGKVMRFAYDKVKGRFGFIAGESGWDHYREYELETDVYNAAGANTIKVVYNGNRIFEVYMNGTKMVATDGRQGQFYLGWNCIGTATDSSMTDMKPYQMWGSSTIDSRATLTISAYASDAATVISGFSCEVTGGYVPEENPGDIVEPEIKTSAEVENFACNIEPQEEGQFNNNAEASNINPHFEVEATFNGGDENGLIGFAFTAEEGKVMRFAYDKVKGRFGFMDGESGWDHYREYELETDVYNAEGANTIKVVYNGNRIFEVYMNGTKMVATDGRQGQFYLGWNCRGTAADSSMTDMKPYQMWGSSTIDSRATLTISAYASDETTEITNFTCTVTGGYGYQEN